MFTSGYLSSDSRNRCEKRSGSEICGDMQDSREDLEDWREDGVIEKSGCLQVLFIF